MKIPQCVAVCRAGEFSVFGNSCFPQRTPLRSLALAVVLILSFSTAQLSATQEMAPTAARRDPQAVGIILAALNAAGGTPAINGIQDITASGTITYNWGGAQAQRNVAIKGRGLTQFRVDATLQDGQYSWGVSNGRRFTKNSDGTVIASPYGNRLSFENVPLPLMQLLAVMQDPSTSVNYLALENRNGANVNHIRIANARVAPRADATMTTAQAGIIDVFIDSTSYQLVSLVTVAYGNDLPGQTYPRELQYSNYQVVNGIALPFTIVELIDGQQTTSLQLSQISLNTGLSDSDFNP